MFSGRIIRVSWYRNISGITDLLWTKYARRFLPPPPLQRNSNVERWCFLLTRTSCLTNNRVDGDLRRRGALAGFTVMFEIPKTGTILLNSDFFIESNLIKFRSLEFFLSYMAWYLFHWSLWDKILILTVSSHNTCYGLISWVFFVKLFSGECCWISLMISQQLPSAMSLDRNE